jgi:2-(1,2-epoxy-1,2-dihydrophenyl)acetyl-CoA isomerase
MTELVKLEAAAGVAKVTLDRPERLNAWTGELANQLLEILNGVDSDPGVRAVVITGAGRAFSAGADLKAGAPLTPGGKPDVVSRLRTAYNPVIARVRTLPKPVIAAVNGPAAGIGCSLALACDLVIAAEAAYFLMSFVNIGLGLDGGASATLAARVGHARAFEIAALGERISAARALEWGLINRVVEDAELDAAVTALASKLAAGAPGSYASIKRTINHQLYRDFDELLELEATLQQQRAESADFAEGVLAFIQKREARFTGS